MELTNEQKERLKAYPVLEQAVNYFIEHKGESEEPGCIPHYTYFFKQKYLNNNVLLVLTKRDILPLSVNSILAVLPIFLNL